MPYYHTYISYKDAQCKDESLIWRDKSDVLVAERIVKPYHSNTNFLCAGIIIVPSDITRILIFKSDKKYQELYLKSGGTLGFVDLWAPVSTVTINDLVGGRVNGVEDVTEFFIIHPPKDKSLPKKVITELTVKTKPLIKDIFIVHGHDVEPVKELRDMLLDFELNPIILHEQASGGLTLAEKLEKYAKNVGYAFVILTPDDVGYSVEGFHDMIMNACIQAHSIQGAVWLSPEDIEQISKYRARQNVIFEMGYFWGLLNRKNVCCLLKGNVEKPSDIDGIVYVPFKESVNDCRKTIIKELNEAGYEIKTDAIVASAHILEINNAKMEVINGALKVTFDISNKGESNLLSLSVFGLIFDKNDTKTSAESTESLGKLPKGKRIPIIQQFHNYDSNFETLTIIIKNDEEILTQELKIDEYLKI